MTELDRDLGPRWFEEVWNKARREAIAEMMASSAVIHEGAMITIGFEGFYPFYDRIRSAFPEMHIAVDDTIAENDKLVVRWSCTCKHTGDGLGFPATGRTAAFTGITILRIAEGKIVEGWQNWDMLGLIEQLQGTGTTATYVGGR
jgi:steroid delta-isomerase-like uncharacterized protein